MSKHLKLTGVIIESKQGGYTGYFAEVPEAIAEGETKDEVKENLIEALSCILDYRRSEKTGENHINGDITFDLNLEVA